MFKSLETVLPRPLGAALLALAVCLPAGAGATERWPGIGRSATPAEIAAWDIDVRPDFAGLPKGSGSVAAGLIVWESRCASCHGTFGESNAVFTPIVGGTTAEDQKTGKVANLRRDDFPQRTTMMKVPTVSTLFDYIRRAMPWDQPKSLSNDEVYAVLAYLLNLSEIVPDNFVLDQNSIKAVQEKMPNRNGMTSAHAMWPGTGFGTEGLKPDVAATPCMQDCAKTVAIKSILPDYARNAHGNLADQMRLFGPVRGIETGPSAAPVENEAELKLSGPALLAENQGCFACHGIDKHIVGPSYREVAAKYKGVDVLKTLAAKMKVGGGGVWGPVEMPPQEDLKDEDAKTLLAWILAGAPVK